MTRAIAVLRPEPGNTRTACRVEAAGAEAIRLPLFRVAPLGWAMPDLAEVDALLLTSANAARHGDIAGSALARLPVWAVGAATAAAAVAAGLTVVRVGDADAATLVADRGATRLLHLGGRERTPLGGIPAIAVYAAEPIAVARPGRLAGCVALLHSARAARRLGELVDAAGLDRATLRLAALSTAVRDAAGAGWEHAAAAPVPTDDALLALAMTLAD